MVMRIFAEELSLPEIRFWQQLIALEQGTFYLQDYGNLHKTEL